MNLGYIYRGYREMVARKRDARLAYYHWLGADAERAAYDNQWACRLDPKASFSLADCKSRDDCLTYFNTDDVSYTFTNGGMKVVGGFVYRNGYDPRA